MTTPEMLPPVEEPMPGHMLTAIRREICQLYLSDSRPWVIGYSGGKDSTCVVQLVWEALSTLGPGQRRKTVHVIASDTLIETPVIIDRLNASLAKMREAAEAALLPIVAEKVYPTLSDTFWVNLLGRGYPAPTTRFRWCTDRLKIRPANKYIRDKVSQYGEVVILLGARRSESATRAQTIKLRSPRGELVSRHSTMPSALVYLPIRELATEDVWTYLLQVPNPWGDDNHDLLAMYKATQDGECPAVVDASTSSCGNSRFGCWVCTVVTREQSLSTLVETGEDWLEPLLEFRESLVETQDPAVKHQYRDYKRRAGRVEIKDGKWIRGPYRLDVCQRLLRQLLEAQTEMRRTGPDPALMLVSEEELLEIRRIWRFERQDWADSLPTIVRDAAGAELDCAAEDIGLLGQRELQLLERSCSQSGIPVQLAQKLLDVEAELYGLARRASIFRRLDSILSEEWRTEDEVRRSRGQELAEDSP